MERLTRLCEDTQDGKFASHVAGSYTGIYSDIEFGEVVERLAYYEDLEEQGLLHKAPVPNGTPIYFVSLLDWLEEDGVHSVEYIHGATENLYGEINKDWYLTEEEAKAKFKYIKETF